MTPTPTTPRPTDATPKPTAEQLLQQLAYDGRIVGWEGCSWDEIQEKFASDPTLAAVVAERDAAVEALALMEVSAREFRDNVLNRRWHLEEPCLDNDQTNAVLAEFDDRFRVALAASRGDATAGDNNSDATNAGKR